MGLLTSADTPGEMIESTRPRTPRDSRKMGKMVSLGVIWLGQSAFLALVGYYAVFSYFGLYDDEGAWLISLRSYHLHGSLYNHTFAQAGPFYYEVWSLVYSAFGMSVDWDTGRLLTLITWIATCIVMGIAIWILTGRVLLGLITELVTFFVMFLLAGVSMEAAGLAHLMGALMLVGLALFLRGSRRIGLFIAGAACAAAVLSKVNIGVFATLALVAAIVIFWPSRSWHIWRRLIVALGLAIFPLLVMAQSLTNPSIWHYYVLELIYLVGLVGIFTRRSAARAFSIGEIAFALWGALGTTILIALGVLVNGTSLSQLLFGAFSSQRGLTKTILLPLPITGTDVAIGIVSSVVAVAIAIYKARHETIPQWLESPGSGYVRVAVGLWILLAISEGGVFPGWTPPGIVVAPGVTILGPGQGFFLAAPFVWVAVLGAKANEDARLSFVRTVVCINAVLGCLEGFPVAGSQRLWASLTLVPVGVLCITDGVSLLGTRSNKRIFSPRSLPGIPLIATALTSMALLGNVGQTLSMWRNTYYANKPMRLMGAESVRLPADVVNNLREVTAFLRQNCTTYWSVPGLNSFYFLAGQEPVTGLNSTQQWWKAFDGHQQALILARLRQIPRLCLVESLYFGQGSHVFGYEAPNVLHIEQTPLVRYLEDKFVLVKIVGGGYYHLLVRQ